MSDPVATARAAWGADLPDWVLCLAEECAATNQARVAEHIGRSGALVSNVLRRKYPGDMEAVEDLVRGRYMRARILCPALGEISTAVCRNWLTKSRTYANENGERVRMYRACRACPKNRKETQDDKA